MRKFSTAVGASAVIAGAAVGTFGPLGMLDSAAAPHISANDTTVTVTVSTTTVTQTNRPKPVYGDPDGQRHPQPCTSIASGACPGYDGGSFELP
ncbi:hypothetical protein BN970_03565 [Mycolicibacterium conceptionense]|uniref:Intersectin-EH binding protein Ibp1 n=1 Tax=Mycolicibacterium conceptionense TaxID=451644 RepID=A0A0U1DJK0_9MYCO|nr:hypothetical protein [Mycolicibacterium conceptionense]ORV24664.1 hypothetical protein AWB98_20725 [Mycolicibacterium conceptionense]CQD16695.1 hypothetical protein BN970_03565 [Mycolicibacterium conceptionense]